MLLHYIARMSQASGCKVNSLNFALGLYPCYGVTGLALKLAVQKSVAMPSGSLHHYIADDASIQELAISARRYSALCVPHS